MNTQQLIESTMLHTLGLLEDQEIAAYEAAFSAAPESVQQLVREEAVRMADFGDLMPSVEPDPALRELVVSAVRAAMREQENDQRIASEPALMSSAAGAATAGFTSGVAGRIDPQIAEQASRRAQPKISTTPRVHRLWRASTIGFAAATIALSVVWTNNNQTFGQQTPDAILSQLYNSFGADYLEATLFDPGTERVSLVSMDSESKAMASVWHNESWDTARLFVKNISATEANPCRVVVLGPDGEIIEEIATFASQGELDNFEIKIDFKQDRKLAIYQSMDEAITGETPMLTSIDSDL
ncbi:MAG: hypothetical protein AB8C13_04130 [Phycisphaerales bacterium]